MYFCFASVFNVCWSIHVVALSFLYPGWTLAVLMTWLSYFASFTRTLACRLIYPVSLMLGLFCCNPTHTCVCVYTCMCIEMSLWPCNVKQVYVNVHDLVICTVIHCACHRLFVYLFFSLDSKMMMNNANIWGKQNIKHTHTVVLHSNIFLFQFYCIIIYLTGIDDIWMLARDRIEDQMEWWVYL